MFWHPLNSFHRVGPLLVITKKSHKHSAVSNGTAAAAAVGYLLLGTPIWHARSASTLFNRLTARTLLLLYGTASSEWKPKIRNHSPFWNWKKIVIIYSEKHTFYYYIYIYTACRDEYSFPLFTSISAGKKFAQQSNPTNTRSNPIRKGHKLGYLKTTSKRWSEKQRTE